MNNISVVINYCSLEREFLNICIRECLKFSDDVVVSYGSHFYDGTIEDHEHIKQEIINNKNIRFVKYEVDVNVDLKKQRGVETRPHAYWHNLARWTGINAIKRNEWILFLDVDEIPNGERLKAWKKEVKLEQETSYSLANYWYFKSPNYQATAWEETAKIIYQKNINEEAVFGDFERDHLQNRGGKKTAHFVLGLDGLPLIHHFSWVRKKEVLLKKIKSWGHKDQIEDPINYVESIFKNKNINDSVHNYKYKYVYNQYRLKINTVDISYPLTTNEYEDNRINRKIEAAMKDSNRSTLLNLTGLKLLLERKVTEAVAYFAEAIESNSQEPDFYNNLGIAICGVGNFDSAIEIFEMTLKIDNKNTEALHYLGRSFFNSGRNSEALQCFLSINNLESVNFENSYYLGCAYLNESKYEKALNCFENLINNGMQDDGIIKNKAICLEYL
jgi:tetratricopeptide (TPR) repeat protein